MRRRLLVTAAAGLAGLYLLLGWATAMFEAEAEFDIYEDAWDR